MRTIQLYHGKSAPSPRLRIAATLSESLCKDMVRPLAGQTDESEALNMTPVLSSAAKRNSQKLPAADASNNRLKVNVPGVIHCEAEGPSAIAALVVIVALRFIALALRYLPVAAIGSGVFWGIGYLLGQ